MRTIFYYDMYARHDVIIESACVWLEDVYSIQFFFNEDCIGAMEYKYAMIFLHCHGMVDNVLIIESACLWLDHE